jgi:hypothetical protein
MPRATLAFDARGRSKDESKAALDSLSCCIDVWCVLFGGACAIARKGKTMNMIRKVSTVALTLTSLLVLAAPSAHAQTASSDAPDRPGVSAGLLLGYGFDDAYKFGLGARGGYTLPQKVYIGGTFVYHFGESNSGGGVTVSEHLLYLGPEGGYDFAIPGVPQILVRPYLGLGFESVSVSTSGSEFNGTGISGLSGSNSGLSFWPGVTGLYSITPNISAGLDARVVIATFGGSDATFAMFLTGQYKF